MINGKMGERLGAMSDYLESAGVDMPAERLNKVVAYLEERGNAKISDLAADLRVSESTIRRDLDILVREGRIQRTHGGAIWIRHSSSYEHVYSEKMLIRIDQKRRIGACCAQLVQDGDTLFLDSGTTTFQIAKAIAAGANAGLVHRLTLAAATTFDSMPFSSMLNVSMSFLGLGIQPPDPSWGSMLSEARTFMEQAPWMAVFPALFIIVTILLFNILGDSLRDVLDPKLKL